MVPGKTLKNSERAFSRMECRETSNAENGMEESARETWGLNPGQGLAGLLQTGGHDQQAVATPYYRIPWQDHAGT
jgi:hypothetical protein